MFLDAIVADVDERVRRLVPVESYLIERAQAAPMGRSLTGALSGAGLEIIAECKQKSPSRGWLTDEYDPVRQARGYESQGARAVSVLTEPTFFAGSLEHLEAVRAAITLPVLRKDFVRHPVQLYEAKAHGADAALIIVRIVDDEMLARLVEVARRIRLEVLVEVHSQGELERALAVGATLIGVNNRDLDTFETRLEFSEEMAALLPDGVIKVSESGIGSRADLARIAGWGYQAALIGESLMRGGGLLAEWTHDQR